MAVTCALRSSSCLMVALARASLVAYCSLASCNSFYAWALSLSVIACLLSSRISIMVRCFYLTSAFSFLEVVRLLSRETHMKRQRRS
jgi:hypothetical protein